jgi:hypothetical protein
VSTYNPAKQTWLNPDIEYLIGAEIIEYDMQDAGFSIIKEFKLLPEDQIRRLESIPKGIARHVEVGKMQGADKDFAKALSDKFAEMRKVFITTNNIPDSDIITVKKDAFFTVGTQRRVRFGQVRFAAKNHYSSYIRLSGIHNLELYISDQGIDVKGMGDKAVNLHRLYWLDTIAKIVGYLESKNPYVKRYLNHFVEQYRNNQLPEEFYVEFSNRSLERNPLFNYQNVIIPLVQITLKELEYGG